MKRKLAFLILGILVLFASCSRKDDLSTTNAPDGNQYLKISKQTVMEINDGEKDTTIIEYIYEKPDDYFWKKSVHKNNEGKITQTIEVEFDENRLPTSSTVIFGGEKTTIYKTCYDKEYLHKLNEAEYQIVDNIEMLVRENSFTYNNEGFLISERGARYPNIPGYVNVDGGKERDEYILQFFPKIDRQGDESYLTYFIRNKKIYSIEEGDRFGKIIYQVATEFDIDGNPTYYRTSEPDCSMHPVEEWYKTEKNTKGQTIAIIGFPDKEMKEPDETSTKMVFGYAENGYEAMFEEFKYNNKTKQYDKLHSAKYIDWKGNYIPNNFGFVNADIKEMSYCLHREVFSSKDTKVEFSKGKIVQKEFFGSYEGQYKGDVKNKELIKVTTYEYAAQPLRKAGK